MVIVCIIDICSALDKPVKLVIGVALGGGNRIAKRELKNRRSLECLAHDGEGDFAKQYFGGQWSLERVALDGRNGFAR